MTDFIWIFLAAVIGIYAGARLEARRWREKGDHEYMNLMESGGSLYTVVRQMEEK